MGDREDADADTAARARGEAVTKPLPVPGAKRRAKAVPPPERFSDQEAPTKTYPAVARASAEQLVVKLAGELDKLPEEAKENLLELLPVLAPLLAGSKREARKRFAGVVGATHPILASRVPGTDQRLFVLLAAFGRLSADDQTILAKTAERFVEG